MQLHALAHYVSACSGPGAAIEVADKAGTAVLGLARRMRAGMKGAGGHAGELVDREGGGEVGEACAFDDWDMEMLLVSSCVCTASLSALLGGRTACFITECMHGIAQGSADCSAERMLVRKWGGEVGLATQLPRAMHLTRSTSESPSGVSLSHPSHRLHGAVCVAGASRLGRTAGSTGVPGRAIPTGAGRSGARVHGRGRAPASQGLHRARPEGAEPGAAAGPQDGRVAANLHVALDRGMQAASAHGERLRHPAAPRRAPGGAPTARGLPL